MQITKLSRTSSWQTWAIWAAVLLLAVAASWVVVRYVSPSPPRSIGFSAGATDGAYYQFALKYKEVFAQNGVTLNVQTSSGSVENLSRLQKADATDAAFVQGGLAGRSLGAAPGDDEDDPTAGLRALAVVGYEPVWVFTRLPKLSGGLQALQGKTVGVGAAGSGSQKLALQLLGAYGITAQQATLVSESPLAAAQKLIDKKLDALIFVAAQQAPAVALLLSNPEIELVGLEHAEGLTRRFPFLQTVQLRRGSVDFAHNLPPRDTPLLATTLNLVVSDDLHPALAYLLLEAAHQTHRSPGLLHAPDDFPSAKGADFSLADAAERFFKNGRPFLQRYLPCWMAKFVQRLLVMLVALVAILFPILKLAPALIEWREKALLSRRYGDLKFLELDIASRTLSPSETQAALAQLDTMEREARAAKFSLDFADRVYTMRQHVDYVRHQLLAQTTTATTTSTPQTP